TESQLLRSLDETEPLHVLRRIAADAAQRFHRLGHEPAPLVIADGFHIHPSPSGQSTDGASLGHIDSVVDYGPKVTPARDIATDSWAAPNMRRTAVSNKPKILGVTGGAVALSGLALALGAC